MGLSILLVSCYELGHQPLNLAWPLAALREAGLGASALDLAVESLPEGAGRGRDLVAVSVPMHTALRLGVDAAGRIRAVNPNAHICFFGHYAWLNREFLLRRGPGTAAIADSVAAGETESVLVELARALAAGRGPAAAGLATAEGGSGPHLARRTLPLPDRSTLPELGMYAQYDDGRGTGVAAGYVESSRGCLHVCRHCPVTPIYGGRFFVVPVETVLADIAQQVKMGARHITFGDPDFLNGPGHALRVARALHTRFPGLTFDFTAKVEHLLKRSSLLAELVRCGAAFVVSAFESTSDDLLQRLDKGHTRRQMEEAVALLNALGLPVQPTWMPFTPWTTLDDYLFLLEWIRGQGLVANVPPVQLSIRMLVPPHSALLDGDGDPSWAGRLEEANFGYSWHHPDPRMDELQWRVAQIAEDETERSHNGAAPDHGPFAAFRRIERAAYGVAGRTPPHRTVPTTRIQPPPRLTEHWFC